MDDARILGDLNTNVQEGYIKIVDIKDGEFIYQLTEKGKERAIQLVANHFEISLEEYLQCPQKVKRLLHTTLVMDMADEQVGEEEFHNDNN